MKTITIGFSKAKSKWAVLSYLIQFIENTPFSHVYITWKSDWLDLQVVYQAAGTSVHFLDSERFNKKALVIKEFELTISDESFKNIVQQCMKKAGSGYSIMQLFYICIYKFCNVLSLPTKWIPADGKKLYVCSELVAELLESEGLIKFDKPLDFITPKDVYIALKNSTIYK